MLVGEKNCRHIASTGSDQDIKILLLAVFVMIALRTLSTISQDLFKVVASWSLNSTFGDTSGLSIPSCGHEGLENLSAVSLLSWICNETSEERG
jgi:hypothetical protein